MSSKSEARRAINNNGIKINDLLVVNENKILELSDFKQENMKVSFGKKKHLYLKLLRFFKAFCINLGVSDLIGLTEVLIFPGVPFILKLIPNKPSPISLGIIMSPTIGNLDKNLLSVFQEPLFLLN